ncbi:MAG: VWA domain-containing protein [Myxococcales bacterium]|nr:VWA domain-containing protein [Myxococcales bacterium]
MARHFLVAIALAIVTTSTSARADDHPRFEAQIDGARQELPLVASDLQVAVRGAIAEIRHTQRFANPATSAIEAVYVFPLPHDAAIGAMTMRIGARTIRAKIERREVARKAYDTARAAGQTAALLEQERPNVFTQSVAGILPGEAIDVELVYDVLLAPTEGWYELALPTVVGPRYVPGAATGTASGTGMVADTDRVPDAARITPPIQAPGSTPATTFGFGLDLQPGFAVAEVDSPTHALVASEVAHDHLAVALAAPAAAADKDVVVRWRLEVPAPTIGVMAGAGDDAGYLTAIVQPPSVPAAATAPRELVFVLDTSGSMDGEPLAIVKQAVRYALDRLEPDDTFRIINFASDVGGFEGGAARAATVGNLRRARSWLNGVGSAGGTEMLSGIRAALADPPTDGRIRYVCFLTDGFIGNDDEILAAIDRERAANVHLFSFGVGSSVNRSLLDEMARAGHGAAQVLLLDEPPQAQIARFFRQLVAPMWSDVRVEFPGLAVDAVTPTPVGDLFAGQPIVVAARYHGGGVGVVRVTARVGDQTATLEQAIALPAAGGDARLLGRLWARQRIRELAAAGRTGDPAAARDAITAIALAHALASPYTSFVAIDDRPRAEGLPQTTVAVPVEAPEGVSTTYGTVLAGDTSLETTYVDGGEMLEVITITDRAPMIDLASTSPGYTLDATTMPGDVAQADNPTGRAGGELGFGLGADLDGRMVTTLRGALRLRLGERYQLGFGGELAARRDVATTVGFLAMLTRWGLWHRLGLRLGLGAGADLGGSVRPALTWRAELLHPMGIAPGLQPVFVLGVSDLAHDQHRPAATAGVVVEF